ncbi:MAG: ABC transporter permease [Proteobacteria bacterium]|nr:ABC transporter permease [Pseudomonadota bacterium]
MSEKTAAVAKPGFAESVTISGYLKERPNLMRVSAVIVFFIFWEFTGRDANELFMSYPSAILKAAWIITVDGSLAEALQASLVPFAIGMTISIVGGIIFGVIMARVWLFEYIIDPYVNALYAIPRLALVPLITLAAGLQMGGKVTIIVSLAIFPIIINTYAGMKDVRGSVLEIGNAFCASERQIFFKIVLPYAIPFIMAGIRLSIGLGIIGMVVAELFTAVTGLGGLIVRYANAFATDRLFVPIVLLAIMGILITQFAQFIEYRLSRWRVLERERAGQ